MVAMTCRPWLCLLLVPVLCRAKLADYYHARGYAARKQGNFAGAVEEYSRALGLTPSHFKALFNRGFSYDKVRGRTGCWRLFQFRLPFQGVQHCLAQGGVAVLGGKHLLKTPSQHVSLTSLGATRGRSHLLMTWQQCPCSAQLCGVAVWPGDVL